MICPTSVPTFPIKGCESNAAILHMDGYKWDTGARAVGKGGRSIQTVPPKYTVTLNAAATQTREYYLWLRDTIKNGTLPFALYADWSGIFRWYIVKFVNPMREFTGKGARRETRIEVYVLGHANRVTQATPAEVVTCDGSVVTCDGQDVYCGGIDGTATDIICY